MGRLYPHLISSDVVIKNATEKHYTVTMWTITKYNLKVPLKLYFVFCFLVICKLYSFKKLQIHDRE